MKLVVGLGNPGPKYETTRHNAGFLAVDRLVDVWNAKGPSTENQGELYEASVAGERVLLIKPQTYMNNSGKCVAPIYKFFKCAPEDLIVIQDEIDIKSGALRIKTGGGSGGHNGLKSLDAHLGAGNLNYHRIRLGVGRPPQPGPSPADWVLQPFTDSELEVFDKLLDDVVKATDLMIRGDARGAMNEFNGKYKDSESE